jgi:hypothetical protein
METICSVQCWKPQEAAAVQLIQLTGEHLRGFALLSGIQSFVYAELCDEVTMENVVDRL